MVHTLHYASLVLFNGRGRMERQMDQPTEQLDEGKKLSRMLICNPCPYCFRKDVTDGHLDRRTDRSIFTDARTC